MSSKIAELLKPTAIIARLAGGNREEVLRELSDCVVQAHSDLGLDAEKIFDVLLKRERLGSTGIGSGIAIPHARLANLPHVCGAIGVCPQGIDFADEDRQPSKIFFVLLAPERPVGAHLKALARVCRLFKGTDLAPLLLSEDSSEEMHRLLIEKDRLL